MDTINSIASSASKAIWGENADNNTNAAAADGTTTTTTNTNTTTNETQGQEPVSGKQGDTSKGEPFDAGNIEPTQTGDNAATESKDTTTASKGPTSEHPSTTGDTGFKAAQADVRDPDTNPTTDPKKEEERKNVDDTGSVDASENPGKVDGPGPRPIEDVARERGGDAGQDGTGAGAGAEGQEEGKEGEPLGSSGENKGSGEEYVKSSGLQADGGDFDATKPGAGREADRLLEEKGIHNPAVEDAKRSEETSAGSESSDSKEKKSLKDKIKAKLHKN
ncbi:hypothetical protein M406DRAFT_343810 [Cryphonectria parasitica EP155]|uniref:Glycine-rich cell wall structural protein 1 n=1 Tax=Cryphonectria parasitica (strain ATCC 38755 / EP155) TaxID=660469 RepID=A0A9P4YAY6_CRYP1|nr:uncharacterized protein M406DRAFT_343810 [Cryphonectria parasitica EP155]KAF3769679.1 hypothetical protein M406DRAFT_343810 [Cryphonectria parasitica EP155]